MSHKLMYACRNVCNLICKSKVCFFKAEADALRDAAGQSFLDVRSAKQRNAKFESEVL